MQCERRKLISRWHRDELGAERRHRAGNALCWVLRRLRAARAGLMNGADRKAVKSELRAALRAKALGLPLSPHAEAVMLWIAWLKRTEGDQAAKRLLAWVVGTSLTVIAWHERIGVRTIQNRLDQSLDAMRWEFSGRES